MVRRLCEEQGCVAPLVRTSVCTKPGKSFAAISFGGFGGSSGKDMGFAATVCVA